MEYCSVETRVKCLVEMKAVDLVLLKVQKMELSLALMTVD